MSKRTAELTHPDSGKAARRATRTRVVLVDDHAMLRDGLRTLLNAQEDMKVIGDAANGRDALELIQRLQPDVVVMDVIMPELNGIDTTYRLKHSCPEVKVLMLSVVATLEHVSRAIRSGARGYLLKESAGEELVDAIRAVQDGQRYLSVTVNDLLINHYLEGEASTGADSPLSALSPRERETLQLVVEGKSSSDIAEILSLSPKTVETYRSRLMRKLAIQDLPGLVRFAIQHGITSLDPPSRPLAGT